MKKIVEEKGGTNLLDKKQLSLLFYQPSTRTRTSFETAMKRLGGDVEAIENVKFSSVSKGESLPDTVRALGSYCDAIVLRHPKVGASKLASRFSPVPIINGGDGHGEHPTQALLDLYTILDERKMDNGDGLVVGMVGDLRYGRTIHSLSKLLSNYDNVSLILVSPDDLRLPIKLKNELEKKGLTIKETDNLEENIGEMDVIYDTRIQEERMDPKLYLKLKDVFLITPQIMEMARPDTILMHPLPRKTRIDWGPDGNLEIIHEGSITYSVDDDPRSVYFKQMRNGMFVRMALLTAVLDRLPD
jgi:aspartate carbamoyltransferase